MLKLIERPFVSLQGEGIQSGKRTCFIRLAGCNLRCSFCDTKYSWEEGSEVSEEEIWTEVRRLPQTTWICITGGEPLLQDLERLLDVIYRRSKGRKAVSIETNGTIIPNGGWLNFIDLLTISPKMTNSGMKDRWEEGTLSALIWRYRGVRRQLKFVCQTVDDIWEAISLLNEMKVHIRSAFLEMPIIIQPDGNVEGQTPEGYWRTYKNFWEFVSHQELPFDLRVLPQLHRVIYGTRRGV